MRRLIFYFVKSLSGKITRASRSNLGSNILLTLSWGEFLKREEKGEEKKELERGLHIFSPPRVQSLLASKHGFFGMVNEESAEIDTTATGNGKISGGR